MNHLGDVILYYTAIQPKKVDRELARLRELLEAEGEPGAIVYQQLYALYYSSLALKHLQEEIKLVKRLLTLGGSVPPFDDKFIARKRDLATELRRLMRAQIEAQA